MLPPIPRPSPALVVAVLALVVAAAGGALAQSGAGAVIQGCVSRTGALELLTPENTSCDATQQPVSWNEQGPKGDKGDPGDRVSPETIAIDQHADSTLGKATVEQPKLSKKQAAQLQQVEPAAGEAYQLLKSAPLQIKNWFVTEEYTYVGRLALPKGRWSVHVKAQATTTADAAQYPESYRGRVQCLLVSPKGGDKGSTQGVVALQLAVYLSKKVNTVGLHCTGWAAGLSDVKMEAIRLRKLTTAGS